ncbi:3-hydroxyacyl-CoA dehydrogenase family protein [Peristeroidobacter soli]|uniref:3-hydroxyacyl-CoA dehydrogenase family protein n=1 Tax=Peristeroidobacter soli TaxID=2497877 RepID=UPI00101C9C69|nr:3-hydroxybutyryl-CoA dehydrogenase [Peristeroidobacter soli]
MSQIKSVGVLGSGQMGGGIAQVAAQSGYSVALADISLAAATAGKQKIERGLAKLVEKGKLEAAKSAEILGRITPVGELAGLADCDVVIEAATENVELKKQLFAKLDAACEKASILATNTSSISITTIAAQTKRPERVVGMHFMNPVPVMQLVEIIRGLATDNAVYESTVALAKAMGKTVVTSNDAPGFLVNRILIPLINEACFVLQEGVGTAEDIDAGARLGLNHPMGPLQLADLIGLDTCLAIAEVLHRDLGDDKYRPATILRNHVAAGWLGRKTGRGFYRY